MDKSIQEDKSFEFQLLFKKINHLKNSKNYGKKLCKSTRQGTKEVRF